MMRRLLFLLLPAFAAAFILAAPGAAAAAPRIAPALPDWTRMVMATPEGGYRMGNPAAPVKLVEYGSITCGHCAAFAREAGEALRARVRTGRVSWEYRPYLVFPTDPGAFQLLRCHGPAAFFTTADELYADRPTWWGKVQALSNEEVNRLMAIASPTEQDAAVARAAGLDAFFRARGMAEARIAACLADAKGLQELLDITERADAQGVPGTPTFFINGVMAEVNEWPYLEPLIAQAGG